MPTQNEIDNARKDALVKKEYEDYEKHMKKERESNEAPRKTVREMLLGIGSKLMPSTPAGKEKKQKSEKSGMELEVENAKKDRQVKQEQEDYEKYDKTRLKDQGGFKKGGIVSSASKRADGCAVRGKTKGRMI